MGKIKMNKLIVDKELLIENFIGQVTYNNKESILNIKGHCILCDYNSASDLVINLEANSSLNYYRLRNNPLNTKTIINHNKNSQCIFKEAILNKDNNFNYNINVNMDADNSSNNVYLRVVNEFGYLHIIANGNVSKDTKNNILLEDLRGLNFNDNKLIIEPNMQILSNSVEANHNVTISNVNKDDLFYLNSKGISDLEAIKLLKNGFILGIFPLEIKEEIKKIIE